MTCFVTNYKATSIKNIDSIMAMQLEWTHTHMHAHTCMYTHTHTHTHMQTNKQACAASYRFLRQKAIPGTRMHAQLV